MKILDQDSETLSCEKNLSSLVGSLDVHRGLPRRWNSFDTLASNSDSRKFLLSTGGKLLDQSFSSFQTCLSSSLKD